MALTVKEVQNAKEGFHGDGNGLYLCVAAKGKSWIFRFKSPTSGKRREMGIGSASLFGLAEAREKAQELAKQVKAGTDPIEYRIAQQAAQEAAQQAADAVAKVKLVTFADAATAYVDSQAAGWKNPKHVDQWRNTLATYCAKFASKPVGDVTVDDVEAALRPIWLTKTETATRVLTRVIAVMRAAKRRGWSDTSVASWSDDLRADLPMLPKKPQRVQHHPALPYVQLAAFMASLRSKTSTGAKALEFTILTAARSGEVRLARWSEIDLDANVWTIPADRMKMKREHRVPLSEQALALLRSIRPETITLTDLVFPGEKQGQPLSDMTLTAAIRRRNEKALIWKDASGEPITVHGFRSTFSDWAAETTSFPSAVVEASLAHGDPDKVRAAYTRTQFVERRAALMQSWADFGDATPSNVVQLNPAKVA